MLISAMVSGIFLDYESLLLMMYSVYLLAYSKSQA